MYKAIVIDDDLWARADIRATFEKVSSDFEIVAEFASAEEALCWLYVHPVDLVVTDICMNRQSGLEMIRTAKENGVETLWIIISGYDDFHFIQEAFRNQVLYYMLKPIRDDDLQYILGRASVQLRQKQVAPIQIEASGYQDLLSSVIAYIEEHYAEEQTLEEIARHFHVDCSYLSHLFVRKTGMRFSLYRNTIRVQHAKELLLHTSKTISEIAFETGYSSSSYFNRTFKDIVGITPMKFRSK